MKKKLIFDNKSGYLLPGIYPVTINALLNHEVLAFTSERVKLINSLQLACETYWNYGITEIYANGSFATAKPIPADIDGYLRVSVHDENVQKLLKSDSIWSNFKGKTHANDKYPMWYEHKIEFYIDYIELPDKYFNPAKFFTHSREGIERGIIKVIQ